MYDVFKNLNASKPYEHPPSGEKMYEGLGRNNGCRDKTSSWYQTDSPFFFGLATNALNVRNNNNNNNVTTSGQQYNFVVVVVFTSKTVLTFIQYPFLSYSSRQRNEFPWLTQNKVPQKNKIKIKKRPKEFVVVVVFTSKTVLTFIQYPSLSYSSRQRNEFPWLTQNKVPQKNKIKINK